MKRAKEGLHNEVRGPLPGGSACQALGVPSQSDSGHPSLRLSPRSREAQLLGFRKNTVLGRKETEQKIVLEIWNKAV